MLSSHTLVVVGTAVSLYILGKSYDRLMKGILVYIFLFLSSFIIIKINAIVRLSEKKCE